MAFSQQLPQGVTDLYADDYELKQALTGQLQHVISSYGYQPIQTPTFEYYDLFMNVPGTMNSDQMIKLIDRDGKVLVLRPDATVPIARMVAQSQSEVETYNKFLYVTNIFRMESGESDRSSRSFSQVGVEWFDDAHPLNDIEMIVMAIESLKQSGLKNIQLELGQAGFFQSLLQEAGLTIEQQLVVQQKVDEKNEYELSRLLTQYQVNDQIKNQLIQLPSLFGSPNYVITEAEKIAVNRGMKQSLKRLVELVNQLEQLGYAHYISIDLGLVNHLNYYSGTMFQGYIEGYGKPIIQGGRYDQLTKYFDLETSAIGFGIYLDDLISIVKKQQSFKTNQLETVDVVTEEKDFVKAMEFAQELRGKGVVVNMHYENDSTTGDPVIYLSEKKVEIKGETFTFTTVEDFLTKAGFKNGNN
ncbi:ATP phosphoribosyltransferase regulatory subunit [Alkalibacillus haloalkaliphilus]|uniref:ATP phosphoribosyltransferase regulatory subunit n=1 Tax=Alkalibacillus haloalkaliphilus TaxID=94136 RepID=A0A511W7Q9_9BACI|nr:ATP phosphoribosyltransferase regulatory subunit [Alkalibacillus haloalkaliphilus]GEN47114.1 ATP phosphoribosyltransferase regulatory subunit [Alkalibacillus haloalkaliphilus]